MVSAIFGPLPVEAGIVRCNDFLETAGENPVIRAFCDGDRAVLEAMTGEFARARALLAESTRALEDLGLTVWAANNAQEAFLIESLAGAPGAATDVLRTSYATLDQMGERGLRATIAGFLAAALYSEGEYEEAARFSLASEEAAATDDVVSQISWRASRAKILARQGELERAEALAREAVGIAEATDLLNTQGDAFSDLAEVLALAGKRGEALAAFEHAVLRYERKGNRTSLDRALGAAHELATASSRP